MRIWRFLFAHLESSRMHINPIWTTSGALLIFIYYFVLVTDAHLNPFQRVPLGLTFNSMLEHLFQGRFDVSADAVQYEGYYREGVTYSYWGIFCALLRLPLFLFPGGLNVDITFLSCALSAWIGTLVKLRTLNIVRQFLPWWLTGFTIVYIIFGSSEVSFLKAIIYQEIILWSDTIASFFLFYAIKCISTGEFSSRNLSWMAAFSGLGLITRVTFGVGMYLALAMLLIHILVKTRFAFFRITILPACILLVFVIVAGFINYQRWGNPATFYDTSGYAMNFIYPDRRVREQAYGMFNVLRIPYSLDYYFAYSWTIFTDAGYLWKDVHNRLFDILELPPSSFLLTDLFTFCIVILSVLMRSDHTPHFNWTAIMFIGAGFLAQVILILCAIATAYRYRLEFHPLFNFMLFIGLLHFKAHKAVWLKRLWLPPLICLIISVIFAHFDLIIYKISLLGPYNLNAPHSIFDYYRWRLS